jgi:ABC-type sugar transport system substrate-binding protein
VEALATVLDPALPRVLGADAERGCFRVEAFASRGQSALALTPADAEALLRALERLHLAGVAHGAVDTSVRATPRGVVLALPPLQGAEAGAVGSARTATPEGDRADVVRLAGGAAR